ncbi:MAG: hypothetical protein M9963_05700 [Kiritimatiellae bacterium]|nr:hypothetical protein [Kiritimatiellia bacterium]
MESDSASDATSAQAALQDELRIARNELAALKTEKAQALAIAESVREGLRKSQQAEAALTVALKQAEETRDRAIQSVREGTDSLTQQAAVREAALQADFDQARGEAKAAQDSVVQLQAAAEALTIAVREANAMRDAAVEAQQSLVADSSAIASELQRVKQTLLEAESARDLAQNQRASLDSDLKLADTRERELIQKLEEAGRLEGSLRADVARLEKEAAETRDRHVGEMTAQEDTASSLRAQIEQLESSMEDAARSHRAAVSEKEEAHGELSREVAGVRAELQQRVDERNALREELDKAKEAWRTERESLMAKLRDSGAAGLEASEQIRALEERIASSERTAQEERAHAAEILAQTQRDLASANEVATGAMAAVEAQKNENAQLRSDMEEQAKKAAEILFQARSELGEERQRLQEELSQTLQAKDAELGKLRAAADERAAELEAAREQALHSVRNEAESERSKWEEQIATATARIAELTAEGSALSERRNSSKK